VVARSRLEHGPQARALCTCVSKLSSSGRGTGALSGLLGLKLLYAKLQRLMRAGCLGSCLGECIGARLLASAQERLERSALARLSLSLLAEQQLPPLPLALALALELVLERARMLAKLRLQVLLLLLVGCDGSVRAGRCQRSRAFCRTSARTRART